MTIHIRPTAKGQITLNKTLMAHLGVGPGDKLEVNVMPGRRLRLARVSAKKPMSDLIGLLTPRDGPSLTDEQIEEAIVRGAVEVYFEGEEAADDGKEQAA